MAEAVQQRFRNHSLTLTKALKNAHERSWDALSVALAGDGFLDRVKMFFSSDDDKGVREQITLFLQSNARAFEGSPANFRQVCLTELKRLRKSGLLSTQDFTVERIAHQTANFKRHTDPQGLIEEALRAVAQVADALPPDYPNLRKLLRTPTPGGPPLLAAAFAYFFRREVETDDELAHGLFFDGLRQLSASQARGFGDVNSDVYAFGKTCCSALFKTTEPRSRHLSGLPSELRDLLERCIEQELEHRHQNFEPVLAVLATLDSARQRAIAEAAHQQREQKNPQQSKQVMTPHARIAATPPPAPALAATPPAPAPPAPPAVSPRELVNSIGMKLVLIPSGRFTMGSPKNEADRQYVETQHEVEITKPFYMGIYPVTQAEFERIMGNNPSRFTSVSGQDTKRFPVESVSWDEAVEFCKKLSGIAEEKREKRLYRLPTEAEWEYACRGGAASSSPFHFGNSLHSSQANFDQYLKRPSVVGSYPANAFGLFDMHGNVWEWCQDWYTETYYQHSPKKDPTGPKSEGLRVLRGGCWAIGAGDCRSARRDFSRPAEIYEFPGFRVVCVRTS